LTVGSTLGQISELFSKVKSINAKHGKFDLVLCVGDFFGPMKGEGDFNADVVALLDGKLEAPLPCYIMAGEHPIPQPVIEKFAKTGGELCLNVFLLGKSAIFTTAEGLRIACLGGTYEPNIYHGSELPQASGFTSPYFNAQTVSKLLSSTLTSSAPRGTSLASIMSTSAVSPLVDILISHTWPAAITEFSELPLPSSSLACIGAPPVDEVVLKTKPRYILASGGGQPPYFWEREPFVWDDEGGRVSRFIGLGAFGCEPTTGKKQRWFYAFSIAPHTAVQQPRPLNVTKNPFTGAPRRQSKRPLDGGEDFRWGQTGKRIRTGACFPGGEQGKPPLGYRCKRCDSAEHFINDCPERQKPPEGYVCRICNTPGHLVRDCPTRHAVGDTGGRKPPEGYVCRACASEAHYIDDCPLVRDRRGEQGHDPHEHGGRGRGRRPPPREIGPGECWFCLSNPALAKHLIVAIGSECYLTLPKGQLVPTHTARDAPPGAQIPNVPGGGHLLIVPIAHFTTLSSIPAELRTSVLGETAKYKTALRAFYSKHHTAGVFFEVGRLSAKGGHAHVQAVPIPLSISKDVERAFREAGEIKGVAFEDEAPDSPMPGTEAGSYFRVELPDGRRIVHWMREGAPFSLQFGRRQVLASLMKLEDRVDWKECSDDEDKADAQAFKTAFAPFDPSS
ncbi:nuclear protein, partial [Vararia minispora EC-137]